MNSNIAAQIYDFELSANATITLLVTGGFYKILRATGTLEVRRDGGSVLAPLYPGQGEREDFIRLTIRDTSGAANKGLVLIAGDGFVDDRITGEVSTIDGQAVRTKAGNGWTAGGNLTGLAATNSHLQIWNPAGSNTNVFVTDIAFGDPAAAGSFQFRSHTAALSGSSTFAKSKKLDLGNHPSVQNYFEQNAALLGLSFGGRYNVAAGQTLSIKPTDPFQLPPGYGLSVANTVVAGGVTAQFQFYTEALLT